MGLESANNILELIASNPVSSDSKTEGDDHIRLLKSVLVNNYGLVILKTSTGETAALADRGKCYVTTGNITCPNSVFAAGNYFYVYNNSASSVTVIQGTGVTLRWGGTTSTGTRTLAARGICQVLYITASEAIISGQGLS